jgi:hypothetical protein
MRLVLTLLLMVYLVGVGVVLAPIVSTRWNSEPVSTFTESVAQALPNALIWPVRFVQDIRRS